MPPSDQGQEQLLHVSVLLTQTPQAPCPSWSPAGILLDTIPPGHSSHPLDMLLVPTQQAQDQTVGGVCAGSVAQARGLHGAAEGHEEKLAGEWGDKEPRDSKWEQVSFL